MNIRRLLAAAAIVHVLVVILLFVAGRTALAPRVIDRDGILAAASDSADYERMAKLPGEWRNAAAPLHVRVLSPFFAVAPRSAGILAAEPFNLACYLAIVALAFAIARTMTGPRAALVAAATVALWPTFVLHTTQLLKDPLFIAATLLLEFLAVTWLTATFGWPRAIASAALMIAASVLLHAIRWQFNVAVFALVLLGVALLVARQIAERRLLLPALASSLAALVAAALLASPPGNTVVKIKQVPSPHRGLPKTFAGGARHVPAVIVRVGSVDRAGSAVGNIRARYNLVDAGTQSAIDTGVELRSVRDVGAYLPRAAAIGLWAPFPNTWAESGTMVTREGHVLAGAETAAVYLFELLAVAGVLLPPRRLPALLLSGIALVGVTALGLVVSNVGTLYRFRYAFWIPLIIAGVAGGEKLARAWRRRSAAVPALACVLLLLGSCARSGRSDLVLTNETGVVIDAVYLSPSDAPTWEENILAGDVLRDGGSIEIRFTNAAKPALWDLRAEGNHSCAEWKRLDASRIGNITLRGRKGVAVAEVDAR